MNRRHFVTMLGLTAAQFTINVRPTFTQAQTVSSLATPIRPERFKKYSGQLAHALFADHTFNSYIASQFKGVSCPFANGVNFLTGLRAWSDGGRVAVEHHRYVMVEGFMQRVWSDRALFWMDTSTRVGGPIPLAAACFLTFNSGQPSLKGSNSRTLWIYTNKSLNPYQPNGVPHHLEMTLARWIRSRKPHTQDLGLIGHVVLSEPESGASGEQPLQFGIKPYRTTPDVALLHKDY